MWRPPRPAAPGRRGNRPGARAYRPCLDPLEDRLLPSATLAKDIVPGPGSSNPSGLTNVNGTLYFTAQDATGATGLWKSDGTAAGTQLVKDFPANRYGVSGVVPFDGKVFFFAHNGTGNGLWETDGTPAGTALVRDFFNTGYLTVSGGRLFFSANDDGTASGYHLWESDGTPSGTQLVSAAAYPQELTDVNGTLYFVGLDPAAPGQPWALWKSDGTPAGTAVVADTPFRGPDGPRPFNLTAFNGTLYFVAPDLATPGQPWALWKSDGTGTGTQVLKDVDPSYLVNFGGTLYFDGGDGSNVGLWKSDGTAAGTVLVKDIQPDPGDDTLQYLTVANGTLYFSAADSFDRADGKSGFALWKSDGTAAGTVPLHYVAPATYGPANLTDVNGTLFFTEMNYAAVGMELWRSDGTPAGTYPVASVRPGVGPSGSENFNLTDVNGTLFFTADDGAHGTELWKVINNPPVTALAGGPYIAEAGAPVTLNAGASFARDGGPLTYSWDINGDGVYGDTTGASPTLTWAQLNALGITQPGFYPVRVRVTDDHGNVDVSPAAELWLTDPTLLVHGTAAATTEGTAWSGVVATLTDPEPAPPEPASTYTALIDWGDGTPASPGVVTQKGSLFQVSGSHTYTDAGAYTIHVSVQDDGGLANTATTSAQVADARFYVNRTFERATEGKPFAGAVGSFTDPGADPPASYKATITWGDGSSSAGTVVARAGGGYSVLGSHTYADEGSYQVGVTVHDEGGSTATTSTIAVADAPLTGTAGAPLAATAGRAAGPLHLATFRDSGGVEAAAAYAAAIAWGDGSTSAGTVRVSGGALVVSGGHTYAAAGTYRATVTLKDAGAAAAVNVTFKVAPASPAASPLRRELFLTPKAARKADRRPGNEPLPPPL